MKFTFAPGSRPLDDYTIKRAIHRGGFGEVYYALSDAGKEVALKLLHRNDEIELRGVRQCLNVKHPNLVTIFDIRRDRDGDPWIIMEYVSGKTLAEVLDQKPNGLSLAEVWEWLPGLVAGMKHLHDCGIVHRDLKPANIYREHGSGGIVKVGDIGLSKMITDSRRNAQTQAVGTVYYMAPEIARGTYGQEIDIYSLGVIVYEMLTGDVPFDGESTGEILMKHMTDQPDLARLPGPLRSVVARSLEKDPQKRIQDAGEFLQQFQTATRELDPNWKPAPLVAAGATVTPVRSARPLDLQETDFYASPKRQVSVKTTPATPQGDPLWSWAALMGKVWVVFAILVGLFVPRELDDFMAGSLVFGLVAAVFFASAHLYRKHILHNRPPEERTTGRFVWDMVRAGGVVWVGLLMTVAIFEPRDLDDYLAFSGVLGGIGLAGALWYGVHSHFFISSTTPANRRTYLFVKHSVIGLALLWLGIAWVALTTLRGHHQEEFMIGSLMIALPVLAGFAVYRGWHKRNRRKEKALHAHETVKLEIVEDGRSRKELRHEDRHARRLERRQQRYERREQRKQQHVRAYNREEVGPETLRCVPLYRRITELTGSLVVATLATGFLTTVVSLFTDMHRDVSLIGFFGGTVLLASSAVLVGSKLLEGTGGDQAIRRLSLALLGVVVGAGAYFLNVFLLADFSPQAYGRPYGLISHVGPQPLLDAQFQPTLTGFVLFFASLFALRRWAWHADSFRSKRFKISSVLLTLLTGYVITTIFAFPQFWGIILAAAVSCVVQISSPWTLPEQRLVLRETQINA